MLRRAALVLHKWIGLIIGLFVLIVSLTGSALVFRPEIDRVLHPDLMIVQPSGDRVPLDTAVDQARSVISGRASLIRMPQRDTDPYVVWPADPEAPLVYIHPYTGNVLGTMHDDEGLTGFLFHLHAELLAGERGMVVMGIVGLLLVLLCITGMVIWWPARGKLYRALTVAWKRNWRRVTYDLHRAGGFWTLAFILVTAVTGAGLVFYEATGHVLNWVAASRTAQPIPPPSVPLSGSGPVSLETALQTALAYLPELQPVYIYPPLQPDAVIGVRGRLPGELHPNGRSFVYVDQYSGEPALVHNALEAGRGERILNTFYPIHIGRFGGLGVRILYVLLGLAPAVLSVTGITLWLTRRRKRTQTPLRPAPQPRGRPTLPVPETASWEKRSTAEKLGAD